MTFPTENDVARALANAMSRSKNLKTSYISAIAVMESSPVSASMILSVAEECVALRDYLNSSMAIPGILQYAKDQFSNQSLDIISEANAVAAALDALALYLEENWPPASGPDPAPDTDREGLYFNTDTGVTYETWGIAKSATLRARMQDVVNTIG